MVRRLDLITKNFIQLNVVFEQPHPYTVTDKPAMTIDIMLSAVGGSLSLWLGMTIMFVFEILEFIYAVVGNWYRETRWKLSDVTSSSGPNAA
jgi:Amiloride-sensitive sodium channel